jgi:hypothetical protein
MGRYLILGSGRIPGISQYNEDSGRRVLHGLGSPVNYVEGFEEYTALGCPCSDYLGV